MGVDWSKQCQAAEDRPTTEIRSALNSSYYTLVAAFSIVATGSFIQLARHLRARNDLWKMYGWFLGLTCVGSLLGEAQRAKQCSRA